MTKTKNIVRLKRKEGLYLKDTRTVKGRGVFCTTAIRKGEILEITPALVLNEKDTAKVDDTFLVNYTFTTDELSKSMKKKTGVKKHADASSVVMGVVSFCNHGEKPNATVLVDEKGGTLYYILKAIRDIPKNVEICTTYGEGWFDDRK